MCSQCTPRCRRRRLFIIVVGILSSSASPSLHRPLRCRPTFALRRPQFCDRNSVSLVASSSSTATSWRTSPFPTAPVTDIETPSLFSPLRHGRQQLLAPTLPSLSCWHSAASWSPLGLCHPWRQRRCLVIIIVVGIVTSSVSASARVDVNSSSSSSPATLRPRRHRLVVIVPSSSTALCLQCHHGCPPPTVLSSRLSTARRSPKLLGFCHCTSMQCRTASALA